jgi:Secretion system C-terminal sorting domain
MKKVLINVILGCFYFNAYPQNLVPNPSFEDTLHCPQYISQINYAPPWFDPSTMGTPDYFNECYNFPWVLVDVPTNVFGYQYARTGQAYAGIFTWSGGSVVNAREYIEVQLIDSLVAGIKYRVSFYANLADSLWYACNSIGAYLSQTLISDTTGHVLPYSPQIFNISSNPLTSKTGWTLISAVFTAVGGEKYITIGNFINDSNSDSIYVGAGGSLFSPDQSYYYIDDVSVIPDSITGFNEHNSILNRIKIYPNPFSSKLEIQSSEKLRQIIIYDLLGETVYQKEFTTNKTEEELNLSFLQLGIYFLNLKNTVPASGGNGYSYTRKIVKM